MSELNVLVVPSWYPSVENPNNGIHFEQQIESLKRKGVNTGIILPPDIISLRKNNFKNYIRYFEKPIISIDNYNGNKIYKISVNGITRFSRFYQTYFRLASEKIFAKYLSENPKPDIIHAHSAYLGGIFSFFIKMKYKIPYVITEHITHFGENKVPLKLIPLLRKVFNRADTRIMVSPQLGKTLEAIFGKNVKPWIWIPNMIPDKYFKTHEDKTGKVMHSKFRFLNIGMMEEDDRKGHKILLKALAEKFSNDKNVELVIIGDGPNRKFLMNMASELKISEQVIFRGSISNDNIASEINKSDVCVISSHIETFGVVALEALAYGRPVVATESGGPECIITKDNGILVPKANPKLLGEAMLNIKNNIKDFNPEIIKDDCYNRFSSSVVAEKLIELYNKSITNN